MMAKQSSRKRGRAERPARRKPAPPRPAPGPADSVARAAGSVSDASRGRPADEDVGGILREAADAVAAAEAALGEISAELHGAADITEEAVREALKTQERAIREAAIAQEQAIAAAQEAIARAVAATSARLWPPG